MTQFDSHPSQTEAATRPVGTRPRLWQGKLTGNLLAIWPGVVSAFVILALLLSFHQVVRGAVKQGAERNTAAALLASANRECKALVEPGASERCSQKILASTAGSVIRTAFSEGF